MKLEDIAKLCRAVDLSQHIDFPVTKEQLVTKNSYFYAWRTHGKYSSHDFYIADLTSKSDSSLTFDVKGIYLSQKEKLVTEPKELAYHLGLYEGTQHTPITSFFLDEQKNHLRAVVGKEKPEEIMLESTLGTKAVNNYREILSAASGVLFHQPKTNDQNKRNITACSDDNDDTRPSKSSKLT